MNLYDFAYTLAVTAAAPMWLLDPAARAKLLLANRQRVGRDVPVLPESTLATILIHAVSVGEVNATPALIAELRRRRADLRFVVTTTTQTGYDCSRKLYENTDVALARFPLDFSSYLNRLFDRTNPSCVVLMELEVWPNFMRECARRRIPVIVANGRVTETALRRYALGGPITRTMFRRLAAAAVQDDTYASRFEKLGVPGERIKVLGTMKFDSATIADKVDGAEAIGRSVGLRHKDLVWVCGSTGPGEERIILRAYRDLLPDHPRLRLIIVPRHPPRFGEVAELIENEGYALVRRSKPPHARAANTESSLPVILGDTMGELRMFYSLADIVFVGRTLVDLGPRQAGSDMIEPAALAKPTIVGPFTGNFDMPMRRFREANAIVEVRGETELRTAVYSLIRAAEKRRDLGIAAQKVVTAARGSTSSHADLILSLL